MTEEEFLKALVESEKTSRAENDEDPDDDP